MSTTEPNADNADINNLIEMYTVQYAHAHEQLLHWSAIMDDSRNNINLLVDSRLAWINTLGRLNQSYNNRTSRTASASTSNMINAVQQNISRSRNSGIANSSTPINLVPRTAPQPLPPQTIELSIPMNFFDIIPIIPTRPQIDTATRACLFRDIVCPPNETCSISLTRFQPDSQVRQIIECGHVFMSVELIRWFGVDYRCPVCRFDIRNHSDNRRQIPQHTHDESDSDSVDDITGSTSQVFDNIEEADV